MRVDFYQLAGTPIETVVPQLSEKVLESGERLLIVAESEGHRALLDEALWSRNPTSFLPHGRSEGDKAADQPILISNRPVAVNTAAFTMLADGIWREEALQFERIFYLFGGDRLDDARTAWRSLSDQPDIMVRYWKQDNGRWRQGP